MSRLNCTRVTAWIIVTLVCCSEVSAAAEAQVSPAQPQTAKLSVPFGQFPYTGKIASDTVNVRSGPGQNFESINKLDADSLVLVEEQVQEWMKIKLPRSSSAYINKAFLSRSAQQPALGTVTSNRVNIRAGAGTTFNVVGQLNKNDTVEIISDQGEWLHIFPRNSCYGWVHAQFVSMFGKPELYLAEEENESKRFLASQPAVPPEPLPAVQTASAARDAASSADTVQPPAAPDAASTEPDGGQKTAAVKKRNGAKKTAAAGDSEVAQPVVLEGKILESGRFFQRFGTHKLQQNKKVSHYLRSDTVNLNSYIYSQVRINGKMTHPVKAKYPVVNVEQITVVQ
ncbi:MAG: SH3 domain-containing protein [Candidatus Omnitrophica bacterium]|nr:SH3 domain-containing protein [Candidatus Omnitrophota bacterium]